MEAAVSAAITITPSKGPMSQALYEAKPGQSLNQRTSLELIKHKTKPQGLLTFPEAGLCWRDSC